MTTREITGTAPRGPRASVPEEGVEVRRYVDALSRSRWLILGIVVVLAGAVYAISTSLPKHYKATASIVKRVTTGPYESVAVDSLTRELNTIDSLLTTPDVLGAAARQVPGQTASSLSGRVSSTVDPNANLIYVTATAGTPREASAIANAVAQTFVQEQADVSRRSYQAARAGLLQELGRVQGQPGASQQEEAIRQRLSELGVSLSTVGSDLSVAQRAEPPGTPASPKPVRNTIIGVLLGLIIGVLVALVRDQLTPRVGGARELSRVLEMPVLASVPYVSTRFGRRTRALSGIEYETYQALAASVRFALPPEQGPHIIVVTSALHAEGKSTVTARLGRALAHSGQRTLLVSADLRWPTLHDLVGVPLEPGLTDTLALAHASSDDDIRRAVFERIHHAPHERRDELDVLASGVKPADPAGLLGSEDTHRVFAAIGELDYAYIVVDAPPLLGIADTLTLARYATALLFVGRLDRLKLENVVDARETLDRIDTPPIGAVAIGARSEASPYYLSGRVPALEEA